MRRKSCDTNICHLEFGRNKDRSPVIKPWYTAWWIFPSHTLVQLLYNSYLNLGMIPSIHITSIRLSITRNNDHTNLGAWFLSSSPIPNTMSVVSSWFYAQLAGLVCGYGYWQRCGSMLEQSRWLRSIEIISGCNSIQAASNNKYADKDKYKWAVNMYERLTVDLLDLHSPMALNANSFGFHVVSCKYIPSYAIFHDCVEQFYDAT